MLHIVASLLRDTGFQWGITLCFIGLDVALGTVKAFLTGTVSSQKARQGVMHKLGFVGAMTLCALIDVAQTQLDLGFRAPVFLTCCVMICLCEIFSICEHLNDMNPQINLNFLQDAKSEVVKQGKHSSDGSKDA